jgi:hypothetical protein
MTAVKSAARTLSERLYSSIFCLKGSCPEKFHFFGAVLDRKLILNPRPDTVNTECRSSQALSTKKEKRNMTKILGGILLIAAAVIFASIFAGLASVGWTVMVRVMLETFKFIGAFLIAVLGIALLEV